VHRLHIRGMDASHCIATLRFSDTIPEGESVKLFLTMQDSLTSAADADIIEFLALLPHSQGGLDVLANGLFHSRWEVRQATLRIFFRLEIHKVLILFNVKKVGSKYLFAINQFYRTVYERLAHELLIAERFFYAQNAIEADRVRLLGALPRTDGMPWGSSGSLSHTNYPLESMEETSSISDYTPSTTTSRPPKSVLKAAQVPRVINV
jgi:hypothetical protein